MRATASATGCERGRSDWVRDRRVSWVWPAAFGAVTVGWLLIPGEAGSLLGAAGFAVAGTLCVGNAIHCRRLHCAVTGPLYLLAAALFGARAAGVAIPSGWIIGGTAVGFVPEWLGRHYFELPRVAPSLATAGTFFAAGLVAACCLGPTLFVLFGVGITSLGALGALEPYRWAFLASGLGCWFLAYHQRRRATIACADKTCGTPSSRRLSGVLLWGSLAALIVAAVYPYVVTLMA
jgi:mercuric ion transport protein